MCKAWCVAACPFSKNRNVNHIQISTWTPQLSWVHQLLISPPRSSLVWPCEGHFASLSLFFFCFFLYSFGPISWSSPLFGLLRNLWLWLAGLWTGECPFGTLSEGNGFLDIFIPTILRLLFPCYYKSVLVMLWHSHLSIIWNIFLPALTFVPIFQLNHSNIRTLFRSHDDIFFSCSVKTLFLVFYRAL